MEGTRPSTDELARSGFVVNFSFWGRTKHGPFAEFSKFSNFSQTFRRLFELFNFWETFRRLFLAVNYPRTLRLNQTHCVQEVLRHCAVAELYALQCTCKQQQTETRHFVEIQSNLFIAGVLCPRQYGGSGIRAASGSADADTTWKAESAVFWLGPRRPPDSDHGIL